MSGPKGTSSVPKNSENCQKVCNLLLLVQLLSQLLPGLKHVEPGSLLSLVGVQKRQSLAVASKPSVQLIQENLVRIPASERPKTDLDLFQKGLEDLIPLAKVAPVARPSPVESILGQKGSFTPGPETEANFPSALLLLRNAGLGAMALPGFPISNNPGHLLKVPIPGLRRVPQEPGIARAICDLVAPILLRGLVGGIERPALKAAAITIALFCGISIQRILR